MRILLAGSFLAVLTGCLPFLRNADVIAVGVHGPKAPTTVIRSRAELDDFLSKARSLPGAQDLDAFAKQIEDARPDFGRQVLVLVRHDASSGSSFGFSTSTDRQGTLVCDIRTRRSGSVRDMRPYWFVVAVERPGPERVEVRVDGQPQSQYARESGEPRPTLE